MKDQTTYRTVESHTYPHTHDHRTPDLCNHCGATRKWVVPDTHLQAIADALQAIADAPKCSHGKIDEHRITMGIHGLFQSTECLRWPTPHQCPKCWCDGAIELRALLDVLVERGNP